MLTSRAVRRDTENWLESAEYDLESARHMLKAGRYLYVVFMCHLAIEKTLKACVTEATQTIPAKTHDLLYLVSKSGLSVPGKMLDFVGKINNASIPTRYPEDIRKMIKDYDRTTATSYIKCSEEIIKWLRNQTILK